MIMEDEKKRGQQRKGGRSNELNEKVHCGKNRISVIKSQAVVLQSAVGSSLSSNIG